MAEVDGEIRPHAVYTIREVSQILKVSDATMRRWVKDGKIRTARVGRAYRFLGSQVLDALTAPTIEQASSDASSPHRGRPPRS